MNITKYIPSIHNWYVEQGEYKCKECNGMRELPRDPDDEMSIEHPTFDCPACNATGQHKNTGEILAEIAGLLVGDAMKAYQENKTCNMIRFKDCLLVLKNNSRHYATRVTKTLFKEYIKNTFEDYIAQAFIKLFDLCGYLKIKPLELNHPEWVIYDNVNEQIMIYLQTIITVHMAIIRNEETVDIDLLRSINYLYCICKSKYIPIGKHIDARLQYMGVEV